MPFLFNIRNYSPEVINIQQHNTELNIILLRMNNFYIKQKKHGICFIICHQHQTKSGEKKAIKTQHILVKTLVFFRKNWTTPYLTTTPSKSFYIIFVDIFSEIINPLKKSIEFEIDNLFKIDTRSSKKTWFTFDLWRYKNCCHRGAIISSYFN